MGKTGSVGGNPSNRVAERENVYLNGNGEHLRSGGGIRYRSVLTNVAYRMTGLNVISPVQSDHA